MQIQHKSIDGVAVICFPCFLMTELHLCLCITVAIFNNLDSQVILKNQSYSKERGSLRGLHYQILPYSEAKLIRFIQGELGWSQV